MRRGDVVYSMLGHSDTITGLALSPDGHYLLSNSMDDTGEWHTCCGCCCLCAVVCICMRNVFTR